MIEIKLLGEPIPKLRPRFRKNGFTYDPQVVAKERTQWELKEIIRHQFANVSLPLKGPIDCEIYFFLPIPQSWPKGKQNLVSWNFYDHTSKPDLDNLVKFYLDCMTEIIYEDDRQIGRILMQKYYDKEPRTEIRIMGKSKNLVEKVEDILSCLSVEEFRELSADLETAADTLGIEFKNANEKTRLTLHLQAAYTLSIFADKYAGMLSQITKKYPGIWKQVREFEETIEKTGKEESPLTCRKISENIITNNLGDEITYYG